MIKSENTLILNENSRRTVKLPSSVRHVLPAGYVISKILVPPVSMRTPYDMEWPSALHKNYLQILQAIRSYLKNSEAYPFEGTKRHYKASKERGIGEDVEYVNDVSLKYQRIVGSSKCEGIIGMLGSKNGIFRQIMQGKRVDNCARAVIGPDPCIDIDEVAVPRVIAEKITVEVKVSGDNVCQIRHLAQNGQLWWREDCLAHPRHVVEGMRFRRALTDGDYVLFNRQPSLTRSSLLCFRVRIRNDDFNTFGMNPQAVGPFNADFDGDEMNIFFGVFREETREELENLCHISNNVIIDGRVELIPVQDVITGCYMMSLEDAPVSKAVADQCEMHYNRDFFNYISINSRSWADITENESYEEQVTTYSLLRACIPDYIDGERITKKYLLNVIKKDKKPLEFLQRLQTIVLIWLSEEGLSVPLSSLVIQEIASNKRTRGGNPFAHLTARSGQDNVIKFQQQCRDIVKTELKSEHVMYMIESGAKGDIVHLQHMAVSLGQQIVLGKPGVFCHNSYVTGLTPDEFFGHQMAAREGVVRTGVSTAESGYLNRKSCKVMADVRVQQALRVQGEPSTERIVIGDPYIISTFNTSVYK
jgi:DNA-directed RNA polymerase II subunit RPB1